MTHRFKATIATLAMICVILCVGCSQGEPRYVNGGRSSSNVVRASKDLFGSDFFLENAADTDLEIEGVTGNRVTGEFGIAKLKVVSQQSKTNETLRQFMEEFRAQQVEFRNIRQTDWAGWNQTWSTTMQALSPIAQAYIQTGGMVAGLRAVRPSVVAELAMALTAGTHDPAELLGSIPPELRADVLRYLIASARAPIQSPPPASQSAPP